MGIHAEIMQDMYEERHFLVNRDLAAYKLKQAEACKYMIEQYCKNPPGSMKDLELLHIHLCAVHQKQFEDLGSPQLDRQILHSGARGWQKPTYSFYFDAMANMAKLECENMFPLVLNVIGYERGRRRYVQLQTLESKPWVLFERDATFNRDICLSFLELHFTFEHICFWLTKAVAMEKNVMALIDNKNARKASQARLS